MQTAPNTIHEGFFQPGLQRYIIRTVCSPLAYLTLC